MMDVTFDMEFLHFLFLVTAVSPLGFLAKYKWSESSYRRYVQQNTNASYSEGRS